MSKAKVYAPRLDADLIPVLYRERKRRRIPMTKLASSLIRAALRYEGVLTGDPVDHMAEKPVRRPRIRKTSIPSTRSRITRS